MNKKTVAIIGGGFSGIATAYNLLRLSEEVEVDIFDDENFSNNGKAYQTTDEAHILNVPACKMGLPHDDEEHFYRWLGINSGIGKEDFAQRKIYRAYLQEIIADLKKHPSLNFINQSVVAVKSEGKNYSLITKDQKTKNYDHIVIACGSAVKKLPSSENSDKIINNIWQFFNQENSAFQELTESSTILIIGSGLTMVDAVLSIKNRGFKGKIIACSGSSKLPLPHALNKIDPVKSLEISDAKLPLSKILQKLKTHAKKADDWRSVINGLRPITSNLWQEFSLEKKRQFLRHLMTFWNIHRHRVAPNNLDQITKMIEEKKLQMVKGKLLNLEIKNQKIIATLSNKKTMEADLVLNAMGFDFSGKVSELLTNLLEEKIITHHPTKLGFTVAQNHPNFHLAGSLLTGELLEITAVPDLRTCAYNIALKILN
ncbi:MAG: hypothetical protein K0R25_78 [Rickettsiaceae bacterium]|jgi:uncharacterized NAD(P)/FAD-binding protein YdhS|nr:hypothetical protein [Rickettsiaceae bacterium]